MVRKARTARVALLVAVVLACALALAQCGASSSGGAGGGAATEIAAGDAALRRAFDEGAGGIQVEGGGTVERVLADDTEGSRHQRFIVRLGSGQTLLVAHNIDVAPRVEGLREGDTVRFRGVYEWSAKGGTIHWTHHDPDGEHAGGWIRHGGRTYQ